MDDSSELERFLAGQQSQGHLDSQGTFTLEARAALRKLARFSLAFPGAWSLKLVQAAVASRARRLDFHHHFSETRVEFRPQPEFEPELESLEARFYQPASEPDHLLMALWCLGVGEARPFALTLDGRTLLWDGQRLNRRKPRQPVSGLRLTVGHRAYDQPGFAPSLLATRKGEHTRCLRERAFTAPLELRVDKRRFDNLAHCPTHGYTSHSHPLWLCLSQAELPALQLARGTFDEPAPPGALSLTRPDWPDDGQTSVAWLLSAHFGRNDAGMLETDRQRCLLYWVRDGVVAARDELPHPSDCVSLALFVSAAGLGTDLSGFGLLESLAKAERTQAALQGVALDLRRLPQLSLATMVARAKRAGLTALGLFLLGGATLAVLSPFLAFFMGGTGLLFNLGQGYHESKLESELQAAQERLVESWPR